MKIERRVRRLDHKFRFQLLAKWLMENYPISKAADVGGSKGLLALILNKSGWNCEVIDLVFPDLVTKYKDIENDKRFDSLVTYAQNKGFKVEIDQVNFKGQNKILFIK